MLRWCCDDVAARCADEGLMARKGHGEAAIPGFEAMRRKDIRWTVKRMRQACCILQCVTCAGHDGHAESSIDAIFVDQTGATCPA